MEDVAIESCTYSRLLTLVLNNARQIATIVMVTGPSQLCLSIPASESCHSTSLSLFSDLLLPRLGGDGVKGKVREEGGFAMEIH